MVEKPAAQVELGRDAATTTVIGAAPRVPRPASSFKQTMIGVAGPELSRMAAPSARTQISKKPATTKPELPDTIRPRSSFPDSTPDLPAPASSSALPAPKGGYLPAPAPAKPPVPERKVGLPEVTRAKPPLPMRHTQTADSDLPAALTFNRKPPAVAADVQPKPAAPNAPPPRPAQPVRVAVEESQLPQLASEPPLVKGISLRSPAIDSGLPPTGGQLPLIGANRPHDPDIDLRLPSIYAEDGPSHKDAKTDDLEIELPSPFSSMGQSQREKPLRDLDFDLELAGRSSPPPHTQKDSSSRTLDRLPVEPDELGFGEVDFLAGSEFSLSSSDANADGAPAESNIAFIPDLDASLGADSRSATAAVSSASLKAQGAGAGLQLPDLTDALPMDSPPHGLDQPSMSRKERGAKLGREELDVGFMPGERDGQVGLGEPTAGRLSAIARTSGGGGTDFGEVSLDIGSNTDQAISTADDASPRERQASTDLEFGAIPQEEVAKPGMKAEEALSASGALQPEPQRRCADTAKASSKTARAVVLATLVTVIVGGAALSVLPDVGLFGASYISDQLRKSEYDRLLAEQSSAAQRALAQDLYPEAIRSLRQLESSEQAHPRARSLKAYMAFIAYAIDLRFGAAPERNSKAKVLLAQLSARTDVDSLALAEAARATDERNLTRAHQKIDDIRRGDPKRIEILVLSAQIEMLDRRPGQALVYWREVESFERSARSAFGSATAEFALGQLDASELSAKMAITRQPRHVGARLLMAHIAMDKRGDSDSEEKSLAQVLAGAADASPAELVSMQTMLGDLNLSRSRISAAEAAYSKALASDPRCSGALRGLGEALYRTGRFSESLARFEAAAQADPDDSTAAVGVAKSQLSLERVRDAVALLSKLLATHEQSFLVNYWYGAALEAVGNREEAEKSFARAVQLGGSEPSSIDAYVSLALLKNQQGRREEAQKLLDTARAKLPLSPKLLVAIGQLALSEGRYEVALDDFRHALQLDPTDIAARFRLGVALRKDRKFDEAMACFEAVAKVDVEFPGLALERGLLYETSGRTDEALKAFEDALAKAPNDPDLMLRVGCGNVAAGRPKEAETLLRKVLEQRPMSAETHHCLGRAQLLEGTNLALALRTLERAVELDPYRPEYYLYVGWAANEAGRIAVAEQALKKALSLDQGLGDAYWQRGVLRFRQGAIKDAVADLTKAIELRPSRFEAHAALAEAYYELGLEVKALEQWRLAVQAQPENASWHLSYGKLLQAINRDADARSELEQALTLGQKLDPPPRWLWEAHRLLARSLGMQASAIPHWQAYLRLSPLDHAYRDEAKQALARLGQPWDDTR